MSEDKRLNEVIRVKKQPKHFVVLDKTFLQDSRLSCKAKGILAYLLSKPDDWKVIVGDIVNNCADGKAAIYSGLKELKEYGYYEKVPVRNEAGTRIIRWESTVYEVPPCLVAEEQFAAEAVEQEVPMKQEGSIIPKEIDENPVSKNSWDVEFVQKEMSVTTDSTESKALLEQNAELSKTEKVETSLFSDFQEVEHEEQENEFIQNRERNNNYNTKYLYYCNNNHNLVMSCQKERQTDFATTLSVIRENINYERFKHSHPFDISLIDEFVSIMVDTILSKGQMVRIGGEEKPRELVKSVLMKLNYWHLEETLRKFQECCTRIKKKRQYVLSMLYHIAMELSIGVTNRAQADFCEKVSTEVAYA